VQYQWADKEQRFDTMRLMVKVMRTHGLTNIVSSAMIIHFFCVSYEWDSEKLVREKLARRDKLLAELRAMENTPAS